MTLLQAVTKTEPDMIRLLHLRTFQVTGLHNGNEVKSVSKIFFTLKLLSWGPNHAKFVVIFHL